MNVYLKDDPRSKLAAGAAGAAAGNGDAFSAAVYARFYETPPQEKGPHHKTWYARGQNFIVAYSKAKAGTRFSRKDQTDEYVLLLPGADAKAKVSAAGETKEIGGFTITIVPPGDSDIEIAAGGEVIRLFSTQSEDLAALCSNAEDYAQHHPHLPPFEPWPAPPEGYSIRSYSLDVPDQEGRFGKIWRCTTFMVNVFPPQHGPRDPSKLSPHHHDTFEQCSLVIGGEYVHHLRWPWTANLADWREDDHEACGAPSVTVIPPKAIHTSAAVDPGVNLLVDIFSPPREDFSKMDGWVLNASEYPMPK